MFFAATCFAAAFLLFKLFYTNYRISIWEDLYCRSLVFFVLSVLYYLSLRRLGMTIFDIKLQIRTTFFSRITTQSLAYVFVYLSLQYSASLLYSSLFIAVMPVLTLIVNRIGLRERNIGMADIIQGILTIVGLILLYDSGESEILSGSGTSHFRRSGPLSFLYGIIGLLLWTVATTLLQRQQHHIHYSIDTLYVSLFNSLLMPAFIFGHFSAYPTKLTYEGMHFVYFLIAGFLTWIGHLLMTHAEAVDTKNRTMLMIYAAVVWALLFDLAILGSPIRIQEIVAGILIVVANLVVSIIKRLKGKK